MYRGGRVDKRRGICRHWRYGQGGRCSRWLCCLQEAMTSLSAVARSSSKESQCEAVMGLFGGVHVAWRGNKAAWRNNRDLVLLPAFLDMLQRIFRTHAYCEQRLLDAASATSISTAEVTVERASTCRGPPSDRSKGAPHHHLRTLPSAHVTNAHALWPYFSLLSSLLYPRLWHAYPVFHHSSSGSL